MKYPLGIIGALIVGAFIMMGVYAPFLASSKPIAIYYDNTLYFPLFRYLFFQGFFTKPLDLFFNLLMFTLPFMLLFLKKRNVLLGLIALQLVLFAWILTGVVKDPASRTQQTPTLNWNQELQSMNGYARLNLVVRHILLQNQDARLQRILNREHLPTLFEKEQEHQKERIIRLEQEGNQEELALLKAKNAWIEAQIPKVSWMVMPLIRPFHWEDDAGGEQALNQELPWWDLTRINRKDLVAGLIFGVRISLVVGFLAVGLALLIGIPIGALAGYYGGVFDILVCRLIEIWESMPTFFMLLLVIAMMQSKSIFIVIAVVGIFGWTSFSRYIRGEFLKQKNLGYVESCRSIGYPDFRIIFRHILPNAIPPLLTLLPFAMMGAITSEAGLSFLGLGEEGSCSWGVLMDEGRSAFPGEAYLLWPPALFLTALLIAIALIGDALRDYLDPKTS